MIPAISVVMVTMPSRAAFRPLALERLLAQTGAPPFELVIAMDAGDLIDVETAAALKRHLGENIKVITGTWATLPDKQNAALAEARAPWFTFWDDDDWCGDQRLATVANASTDDVDIIGPRSILYHELIGERRRTLEFTTAAHVVDGVALIRRALWTKTPFEASKSRHPDAAHWGTVGEWIVQRAREQAGVEVVAFDYVAMVHADNATMPHRPFRVDEKTGSVHDGPNDFKIVGGLQAVADLMGSDTLKKYEAAFAATAARMKAKVKR